VEHVDPRLVRRARDAAAWIREHRGRTVTVVHHVDADGVTAGAVALEALERAGIDAREVMVKSLDDLHVRKVLDAGPEALWFCDLGSAAYMRFPDVPRLVCDHHTLVRDGTEETFAHLNPQLDGIDGGTVSGAGCAFLAAEALDPVNADLLPLALVGASADLQDRQGGFRGADRALLEAGVAAGRLEAAWDLAWFGPESRPLRKYFGLARDPGVPTVTGDRRAVEAFFALLDIPLLAKGAERTWGALREEERRRIRSALVERVLRAGLGADHARRLFREVVRIAGEAPGPTRELQEYGTLLNSTARYDRPEVGLAVARGDRGDAYQEALGLLQGHRKHLVAALDAFGQAGVAEEQGIQWVHLRDRVRDTVLGIVCGMALDGLGLRRDLALVGFAHTTDGRTKVSSRAPYELQHRGIDLAAAMRTAAEAVGGQGGGHRGAAGATIPRGTEAEFLRTVDPLVAAQTGRTSTVSPHRL